MPAHTNPPGTQRPAPADLQIASSNATANAFIRTRQPSWATSSTVTVTGSKSTSRPFQPRLPVAQPARQKQQQQRQQQNQQPSPLPLQPQRQHQQQQQQQQQQAQAQAPVQSVLPSPAPSDEPSPALSNALDSPNPNSASLAEAQSMASPAVPTAIALPVTESRFVHDNTIDAFAPSTDETSAVSDHGPLVAPVLSVHPQYLASHQNQPAPSNGPVQPPSPAGPLHPPLALGARTETEPSTSVIRPQVTRGHNSPALSSAAAPPAKRRRTGTIQNGQNPFTVKIDQHILSCGGEQGLDPNVARPRILLLKDACAKNDIFFLALHQLYCIWSRMPEKVYQLLPYPPTHIDHALAIIESLLKKNQAVDTVHQLWFMDFPDSIDYLLRSMPSYKSAFNQVVIFIAKLHSNCGMLTKIASERGYPFLVEELLNHLGCFSLVMQSIFFTASRRRLGIPDGPLAAALEQAFRKDQAAHFHNGAFSTPTASTGDMVKNTAHLVNYYRSIVARIHSGPQPSTAAQLQAARTQAVSSLQNYLTLSNSNLQSPNLESYSPDANSGVPGQYVLPSNHAQAQIFSTHHLTQPQRAANTAQTHWTASRQQQQQQQRQQPEQLQAIQPAQQSSATHSQQLAHQQPLFQWRQWPHNVSQHGHLAAPAMLQHGQMTHPQAQFSPTGINFPSLSIQSPSSNTPPFTLASATPAQRTPQSDINQQAARQETYQRKNVSQAKDALFPPKGALIPRPEWPSDPNEPKSILMSLQQAHLRSPKRIQRDNESERFYQAVKSLPLVPTLVAPKNFIQELYFEVTEEQLALRSSISNFGNVIGGTDSDNPTGFVLPVAEYFNGSLRWRLRCCRVPMTDKALTEEQWSTLDMRWPTNIFLTLNGQALTTRRTPQHGKDLPIELTELVVCGTNTLLISIPDLKNDQADNRYLAVEMLETLRHSDVLDCIWSRGVLAEDQTLNTIKQRLTGSPDDDDGVQFEAPYLSIDLCDPFTSCIFKIPARGAACTHMECFDLETWLVTRPPAKPASKCPHGVTATGCGCKAGKEPSHPDKWKCPICDKDARPYSLRIDGFLHGVRKRLEEAGTAKKAKSLRVMADGTWEAVLEEDDDGEDSEGASTPAAFGSRKSSSAGFGTIIKKKQSSTGPARRQQEIEVIELD